MAGSAPLLSVAPAKDGVWQVNERGPNRMAVAYFPSKWGAMRHAVRLSRDYDNPDPSEVEIP